MKIILAKPRGFCAGVDMAIESLEMALQAFGRPVYVFHEIVHNQHVVKRFEQQGAIFVNAVDQVPIGSYLLFSAHGVSPEVRMQAQERQLITFDATCPLVTKVHIQARVFAQKGCTIVLIGHEGHDEVIGTMGEAPEAIVLVESPEDVDRLVVTDSKNIAYLTQTTLSVDDANRIISRLKLRFPNILGPSTADICYATQNRQAAVRQLLAQVDAALVLGSQNSSNSQRLVELAREAGVIAYLIDDATGIDPDWFTGDETILLTSGASAPEDVVQGCIDFFRDAYEATVSEQTVVSENVHFVVPKDLQAAAS